MARFCPEWHKLASLLALLALSQLTSAKLECDPNGSEKKPDPENPSSYLYCNLEGLYAKRNCPDGKQFNSQTNECEIAQFDRRLSHDDPILAPQFQAPDDICGAGGMPLTKLSSPVVCNPSMDSCPDGYECSVYARTGTAYCCQNPTQLRMANADVTCSGNQVTFYEPLSGEPRTCVLSGASGASHSCPTGFGCNLVGGTITRCCGRDFGCPYNSAGFVNPHTGGSVQCSVGDDASCPEGFVCTQSSMFNGGICCSDTSAAVNDACLGDTPLASPNPCSATHPCPNGYQCRNGRCCPAKGMCPVGSPLGGVTSCSAENPCPNNYQCVTSNGQQYCCPAPEHVCNQPKETGVVCDNPQTPVVRYYFDESTGSCRSFRYSQCGGNANNFDTLEQCEGFCVTSQCPQGRPFRSGASNAACSPQSPSTCPNGFACLQPLFGLNHICCESEELACQDAVSAGTDCFGAGLTIQRFHFNSDTGRCESFQFYGCHGSSNNFLTRQECELTCQINIRSVCNGVAPLTDPSGQPQRCSPTSPCPAGNSCNLRGFCCPHPEYACHAPRSTGSACAQFRPDTFWFFDTMAMECAPFTFNGCGGTVNRFVSKEACDRICRNQMGDCPVGMTVAEAIVGGGPQQCRIGVMGGCLAPGATCVLSTSNSPICCRSLARCPAGRDPYLIPGSDSTVACSPNDDTCPNGFECEAAVGVGVTDFHMCCSEMAESVFGHFGSRRPHGNRINSNSITRFRQASPSKCPGGLASNGQRCVVNAIGGCPRGHVCLGSGSHGVCCRGLPKCTEARLKPYYFSGKQVLVCGEDQIFCPDKTVCSESTIDGVDICCQATRAGTHLASSTAGIPRCRDNHIPFFELGSREPKTCDETASGNECPEDFECSRASDDQYYCCPSWEKCPKGASPFLVAGTRKPLGCNIMANNCPEGYSCEGPKDRAICCRGRATHAMCPEHRKPFMYARKPLVCPPGSRKCPQGFECMPAATGNLHVCCSVQADAAIKQDCPNGAAYGNPFTHEKQLCNPAMSNCPSGYICRKSSASEEFVCCSSDSLNSLEHKFEGFCPPGQIPYLGLNHFEPPTCHMTLSPCPTTAPYQCIYSAEKQNSFCCTPTGSAQLAFAYHSRRQYPNPHGSNQMHPGNQQGTPNRASVPLIPSGPLTGPNGEQLTPNQVPIQLLSAATLPPALPGAPISGCPPQSQPLLNAETRLPHQCSTMLRCPDGFTCYSNYPDGRNAQCCTTMPSSEDDAAFARAMRPGVNREPVKMCPPGFIKLGDVCKRMFFVGQPGCSVTEQCQSISNATFCEKGYCRCPEPKLIHQSECVDACPDGYVHIAGRCHDLTTIVFMDSVEERANGTIGGFCMETVVAEEQCLVPNAYCSERSITCMCKPGFELKMNFEDKNDKGSCNKVEDSKFDDEQYLAPAADDVGAPDEIPLASLPDFFIVTANDIPDVVEAAGNETVNEEDKLAAAVLLNDTASLFLQVDA